MTGQKIANNVATSAIGSDFIRNGKIWDYIEKVTGLIKGTKCVPQSLSEKQ
jgi:hypothetical protein